MNFTCEPTHDALLSDAGSGTVRDDFFLCACAVTGVALQNVRNVTGEDNTMHSSVWQHKGAHPKKTTIHSPEQT